MQKIIKNLISAEEKRQATTINLIASENYVSADVREALGSVFTNKYAEGYPKMRYYGGNEFVDKLESLTKKTALKLFKLSPQIWDVNVQPYSGSPANLAVYLALVLRGEKIMGLRLNMGGHLTHGYKASVTGKLWRQIAYNVNEKTERLGYDEIHKIAKKEKPKIIVAGFSAYSRIIDFKAFRKIADKTGAIFMVDMSHFAGLVAGGAYPSPFSYADIVTTTTHKTLRGPRSALIFSKKIFSEKIDKMIFPGLQGGPHANQIAAVSVSLFEASKPAFKKYAKQVVKNAKILSDKMKKYGWRVVSDGTDSHLFLVDVWQNGVSGKTASDLLEKSGIIVNKNVIPYDSRGPADPSGIRLGTPAITTRGMKEKEMKIIAGWIAEILKAPENERPAIQRKIKAEVKKLCERFPVP